MSDDVRPFEVDASEILKPTESERIAALETLVDTLNLRLLTAEVDITSLKRRLERLSSGVRR
jgi:molecular chaperone GrpE (heat shock protein)